MYNIQALFSGTDLSSTLNPSMFSRELQILYSAKGAQVYI